jgi:3-hydroxyacyl-CoA dehydrogenase/3-hydroxy-2-methylbutyryl-CoA dehydrogenase
MRLKMKIPGSATIITGGCGNLGRATMELFTSLGGKVLMCDLNAELGVQIAESNEHAEFFQCDVTNEAQVEAAVARCVELFGRLDVVINTAGMPHSENLITETGVHSIENFNRVFAINVTGTFNFCRFGAFQMKNNTPNEKGERGAIVNISSVAGCEGRTEEQAYAPSKGAIDGMTLPMARDLSRFGIRVNTVAPGPFDSPMSAQISASAKAGLISNIPIGRFGEPPEFAHCMKFLVENTYMTGAIVRLDGGLRVPFV